MAELTKQQLTQLEQELQTLKQELESMLSAEQASSETVTLDQSRVGRLSRMDAMQQQAMAQAEATRLTQRYKLVIQALKKLSQDDYGYCSQCDELINFQRLMIKPESSLCIECQEAAEQ